jgi:phosphate transport system substrate-binding protein
MGSSAPRTVTSRLAGRPIQIAGVALIWSIVAGTPTAGSRGAGQLTIAGCGAGVPIVQQLAAAFVATRPDVHVEVTTVGSTAGIALGTAGAVDIAITSRALRTEEEDVALILVPFARTAVVLAAHPSVPVVGVTTAELLELFKGTKTRWASGVRITLLTREWGESVLEGLRRTVPGFARAYAEGLDTSHMRLVYSEPALHRALRATPYAVGLSSAGALALDGKGLKWLLLDGVAPTPENVARGHYPLSQTLAFILRDDLASPLAREFVAFAHSATARSLLHRHGYLQVLR